jgi:hypothetical protein
MEVEGVVRETTFKREEENIFSGFEESQVVPSRRGGDTERMKLWEAKMWSFRLWTLL